MAEHKIARGLKEALKVMRCDHELEPIDNYTAIEKARIRVCRKCGARFTSFREE